MGRKIITNMSFQTYEKKYKNYKRKLIVFSKQEIMDFDKQADTKGQAYVLNKKKWAKIGDKYYEIPKAPSFTWFKGLNAGAKLATCLVPILGIGALGGAGYGIYYLLNNNSGALIDASCREYADIVSDTTGENGSRTIVIKEKGDNTIVSIDVTIGDHKCTSNEYHYGCDNKDNKWTIIIYKETLAKYQGKIVLAPIVSSKFDGKVTSEGWDEAINYLIILDANRNFKVHHTASKEEKTYFENGLDEKTESGEKSSFMKKFENLFYKHNGTSWELYEGKKKGFDFDDVIKDKDISIQSYIGKFSDFTFNDGVYTKTSAFNNETETISFKFLSKNRISVFSLSSVGTDKFEFSDYGSTTFKSPEWKKPVVEDFEIEGEHNVDIDSENEFIFTTTDSKGASVSVDWSIVSNPTDSLSIDSGGVLTINKKDVGNISATITATSKIDKSKTSTFEIEVGSFGKLSFKDNFDVSAMNETVDGTITIPSRCYKDGWHEVSGIAEKGFANCAKLSEVKLPNSITTIKVDAFNACSITDVKIPTSVSVIEKNAFLKAKLESASMLDKIDTIWIIEKDTEESIDTSKLTEAQIAEKLINSETASFRWAKPNYKYLQFEPIAETKTCSVKWNKNVPIPVGTQMVIPNKITINDVVYSVTEIAQYGFAGYCEEKSTDCENIVNFVLPDTLQKINFQAFNGCKMKTLDFSKCKSLNSIVYWSICYCSKLTSVTFPEKCALSSIENGVFNHCPSLNDITLPSNIVSIGEDAFGSCGLTTLSIPSSVSNICKNAFSECEQLTKIVFEDKLLKNWTLTKEGENDVSWDASEDTEKNATALKSTYASYNWSKNRNRTIWEGTEQEITESNPITLDISKLTISDCCKLVVHYNTSGSANATHTAKLKTGKDTLITTIDNLPEGSLTFEHLLSAQDIVTINNDGGTLLVSGEGYKVSKIECVEPGLETTIMEGDEEIDWTEGVAKWIALNVDVKDIKVGDILTVSYKLNSKTSHTAKIVTCSWKYTLMNDYTLTDQTGKFSIQITQEMMNSIRDDYNELVIVGIGYNVTKITKR